MWFAHVINVLRKDLGTMKAIFMAFRIENAN